MVLTAANAGSKDTIDSDALQSDGKAFINCQTGSPGQNDHSYDFGFQAPDCQTTDLTEALVRMDSAATGIRNLTRQAVKRVQKLNSQRKCSNQSAKQLRAIQTEQENAYVSLWNSVWSVPTTTVTCQTTPLSCNDINLASYSTTISGGTSQMAARLNTLYGNKCLKSKDDQKRISQNKGVVDRLVKDSANALNSLQGNIRTCAP